MDKKILRTLAVLTVGFGLNAMTPHHANAEMTYRGVPIDAPNQQLGWTHDITAGLSREYRMKGIARVQSCDRVTPLSTGNVQFYNESH